jgi:hypothetical protein
MTTVEWAEEMRRQGRAAELAINDSVSIHAFQLARIEALLFLIFRGKRDGQLVEYTEREVEREMLRQRQTEPPP